VTPAVVASWFASFPVICGENEKDSLFARVENDTSDKNPDNIAAILYKQHVRVWEWRRSVDTSQMLSVMPKEDGA
jgi:hypothetical protein